MANINFAEHDNEVVTAFTATIPPSQTVRLNRPLNLLLSLDTVRAYQKAVLKHNNNQDQRSYMLSSMTNGCIPKGIHDQSKFRLSFPNPVLELTCQQLFYFAASRASDVIRNSLAQKVSSLRQSVFKLDQQLKQTLTEKEYHRVLEHTGKLVGKQRQDNETRHKRKLERDCKDCNHYIPWQSYANISQRKKRKSRIVKKAPRQPSKKLKRRSIRSFPTTTSSLELPALNTSECPPPVINLLSSTSLSGGHFGIFTKGPKFVPTPPKADFAEFQEDIRIWKNRLRWAIHHDSKESTSNESEHSEQPHIAVETSLIKTNKSKFDAPISKNLALELFLQKIDEDIKEHKEKKVLGDNLTKDERKALREMKNWKTTIIRPYDKGVGFIIDDLENYKARIIKEISNPAIYSKVTDVAGAIPAINNRIQDWIERFREELSPKLQTWMIDKNAGFGYFYMNYKAHKPEKGYPGRMITSGCGSPTERLSSWCEYYLKPLMTKLSFRLEDTSHFLRKLLIYNEKRLCEDDPRPIILCSWDIEAMYPNITNELGLAACRLLLDQRETLEPSTDCIMEAIQITLEENIAQFGDIVVKQCDGTAMGPHHACSYADAAADLAIDQKVMDPLTNPLNHCIDDWSRFRDDILCVWTGSETELLNFNEWLNNLHPRLKFTMEYSKNSVVFLDLRLSIAGPMIITEMYSKSSDTHAYLMPTSCHPSHICRNIPKGVMKRVKRNCTDQDACLRGYEEYRNHLQKRGYNEGLVQKAIDEANATSREQLLGLVEKEDNYPSAPRKQFPLVIKFNPRLPPMSKFINRHLTVLELTNQTKSLFNKSSLFVSYRMEKNILNMITSNKFKSDTPVVASSTQGTTPTVQLPDDPSWGCKPCPKTCTLCKHFLREATTFTSPKTSQIYKIKSHIDCNTKNVVYLISDLKCESIFYIGYTTDCMAVRWRNHKSHIKKGIKSCELASHFEQLSESIHKLDKSSQSTFTSQLSEHLSVVLIECVKPRPGTDVETTLKEREDFWQGALKSTPLFGGINKRTNKTRARK